MKIIAAVDGSNSSAAALNAIKGMSFADGACELKLVTVAKTQNDSLSEDALKDLADELRSTLEGIEVTYEIATGDAKARILEVAKRWAADLIVMGSRGKKGVDLLFMGSVSQGVIAQAPCPVIVVKSEEGKDSQWGFKSILLTADNSSYSQTALEWLKSIKFGDDARFTVASVIPRMIDSIDSMQSAFSVSKIEMEHQATQDFVKNELQKLANDLSSTVGPYKVSVQFGEGDPKEEILKIAAACKADLIVMGSHGRTGLSKLLLGSVSQAVSVQAPCAVAIVRSIDTSGGKARMQQTGMFNTKR